MSFSTPPKNLFDPSLAPPPARANADGILDGVEAANQINLAAPAATSVSLTSRARRRLWTVAGTFVALLSATYLVPGAERFRPWKAGEGYIPFWNLIGRELLGEGKAAELANAETEALVELSEEPVPLEADRTGAELALNGVVLEDNNPAPKDHRPSAERNSAAQAPNSAAVGDNAATGGNAAQREQGNGATAPAAVADGAGVPAELAVPDSQRAATAKLASQSNIPLPAVFPDYAALAGELEQPKVQIEGAERLDTYFRKLTLVQLGLPTIARAAMWGDSVLGNDGVTHAIRRRMQARFGDSGHGFMAIGRYNPAYFHQGVRFQDRGGWRRCEIIFRCEDDGNYGYAGVTATSSGGGETWFSTVKQGFGSRVSRFEVWFAKRPDGGKIQVKVDGQVMAMVSTAGALGDGVEVVPMEDGFHEIEVRAAGGGPVKAYGGVLERDVSGVVWDSLGLIGSFTQRLDYQEPQHLARQIAQRNVDMLSFILGGNDVQREKMDLVHSMTRYEDEYTRVIRKFRKGRPEASCLVLSLVDHGERVGPHEIRTRGIVPKLVQAQRKVAQAEGCAFFDTFTAQGGDGAVARWYRATPQLVGADFAHPTQAGHEVIAALLHKSLMFAYAKYREQMAGKPFSAP